VGSPPEARNPLAEGMAWVSRITTIAIQMVLPAVAGHFADRYLGTWFLVLVGAALGMWLGFWQLLAIARKNREKNRPPSERPKENDSPSSRS
jgi:hypothetical protein